MQGLLREGAFWLLLLAMLSVLPCMHVSALQCLACWSQALCAGICAVEAEDDGALLKLLDKRCADLQAQHEKDLKEITELTTRCTELQSDLDACLDTLECDHSHLVPTAAGAARRADLDSLASQDELVCALTAPSGHAPHGSLLP